MGSRGLKKLLKKGSHPHKLKKMQKLTLHWKNATGLLLFGPWKNVTFSPEESNPAGCHRRGHKNLMSLHEEKKLKMSRG